MMNWSIRLRASLDGHVDFRYYVAYWYVDYSTFLAAGHDTSTKTLTWYFYAIAKHPEAQVRIREEIALVRARAAGEDFTVADLDGTVWYTLKVVFDFTFSVSLIPLTKCRSR